MKRIYKNGIIVCDNKECTKRAEQGYCLFIEKVALICNDYIKPK